MKDKMKRFIELLQALTDEDFFEPSEDGVRYAKPTDAVCAVEECASVMLFETGGMCNWENINTLGESGYEVYCGEKDSFGWLTGCIQLPGDEYKVVVYG